MKEASQVAQKRIMRRMKVIEVLILEDISSDAELIKATLKSAEFNMNFNVVSTKDSFKKALKNDPPDLILSDYNLPDFTGEDALEYALAHAPDTPFIVVTGALGEETAVQMILSGATDFLLKDHLHNLPASIIRAMKLSDEKKAKNMAITLMERSEMHFRGLIENSYDPILVFDREGVISYGSPSFMRLLGYQHDEVSGRRVTDYIHEDDVETTLKEFNKLINTSTKKSLMKQRLIKKNGKFHWVEAILTDQRKVEGVGAFVANLKDIHSFVIAQEELHHKNILLNSVLDNLSEGVIAADKNEEYIIYNKAAEGILGVSRSESRLKKKSSNHLQLKPDLTTPFKKSELPIIRALKGESLDDVGMYVKNKGAEEGSHVSVNARPLYGPSGKIIGGITSFRDVTSIKHYQDELQKALNYMEERVRERTEELLHAHKRLREAHQHITYSINYAQKIQQAIAPSETEFKKAFNEFFTLYRPKDIVSGDYLWLHHGAGNHLAVVDCTGHGVPGAMMSMIGMELLERIVIDRRIHRPEIILEELDKSVMRLMKRENSAASMNDGMDLSLCSFDFENREISFAGAHNNALLIRKDEAIILEADRHSIGGFVIKKKKEFRRVVQSYSPGDRLYMFTDGFQDQFGGPNVKKFTKKRLINLLKESQHLSMSEQHDHILDVLKSWQGNEMQIDDVTLVGVQL